MQDAEGWNPRPIEVSRGGGRAYASTAGVKDERSAQPRPIDGKPSEGVTLALGHSLLVAKRRVRIARVHRRQGPLGHLTGLKLCTGGVGVRMCVPLSAGNCTLGAGEASGQTTKWTTVRQSRGTWGHTVHQQCDLLLCRNSTRSPPPPPPRPASPPPERGLPDKHHKADLRVWGTNGGGGCVQSHLTSPASLCKVESHESLLVTPPPRHPQTEQCVQLPSYVSLKFSVGVDFPVVAMLC